MDTSSIPGLELIQVADVVAREKSIEREEVMLAMEEAIQKAGRAKYGLDRDIRAMIDRKTGAIRLERWIEVVEEVENESMQMSLAEGAKQNPPLAAGEFWRQSLPPIEFGRIAAQTAKQVISQKVRDAERARQFEEYKHRIGEIVVGTVKRAESYSITVDLARAPSHAARSSTAQDHAAEPSQPPESPPPPPPPALLPSPSSAPPTPLAPLASLRSAATAARSFAHTSWA